jgi:branched-chain amino acid transport system ATP-binding protein/branched-chain amino acid transport system permease protein
VTGAMRTLARTRSALAEAGVAAQSSWSPRLTGAAAALALAALVPLLPFDLGLHRLAATLYLALAAVGLGLTAGLGGVPSLAQGAFAATGAFSAAGLVARHGWPVAPAVVVGTACACLAGLLAGLVLARVGSVLVAAATWLIAWGASFALTGFPELSGGAQGIVLPAEALGPAAHYELALGLVAAAVAALAVIARGQPGLALAAVRDQPEAAAAVGVPLARLRVGSFVGAAAIGGLAGALAVQLAGVADPTAYGPALSVKLFIAVVLGGATAAAGGLVGVLLLGLLTLATEAGGLEGFQAGRVQTLLAAIAVLVFLGLGDAGLLPSLRRARPAPPRPQPPPVPTRRPVELPARRSPEGETLLEATGLRRSFGSLVAVDGVDLELETGSVHALVGPNGSGKTTVLKLLAGSLGDEGGAVLLAGRDVSRLTARERALAGIVRTLQATAVFAGHSALENVLVGAGLRRRYGGAGRTLLATPKSRAETAGTRAAAGRALEAVGLDWAAAARADGLAAFDQRLLMIATTLATQPRVLLLDEPAAGAGTDDLERIATLLARLRGQGLAVLLVEHNLRLVRAAADRVTVLEAGRVIASGAPGTVARDPAVRRAYLGALPL